MNQQATELEEAIIGACLIEQEALPLVAVPKCSTTTVTN